MPLGMEVGLGPGEFVLDGDLAPPPQKRGGAPKFSAHVYCGHKLTAGWIKMVLGMEIGLSPGDFEFSTHVYYRYCNFVETLRRRKVCHVMRTSGRRLHSAAADDRGSHRACSVLRALRAV